MPRWPAPIKGRQRIRGILTPEQEARGYHLVEVNDHFVELWHRDKCVKVFSSSGATRVSLQREVEQDWDRRRHTGG